MSHINNWFSTIKLLVLVFSALKKSMSKNSLVQYQPTLFPSWRTSTMSMIDLDWKENSCNTPSLSYVIMIFQFCYRFYGNLSRNKHLYSGQNYIFAEHKPYEHRWLMTQTQHQLRSSTNSVPNILTGSTSVVGFSRKGVIIVVLKSWQQTSACPSGESWCWQRVDASSFYWSDSLTNLYQSWHLTNI